MENFKGIYLARQDFLCCFHLLHICCSQLHATPQQSGAKETFAYKTTYDVSYSIENLDDYMQGFGG